MQAFRMTQKTLNWNETFRPLPKMWNGFALCLFCKVCEFLEKRASQSEHNIFLTRKKKEIICRYLSIWMNINLYFQISACAYISVHRADFSTVQTQSEVHLVQHVVEKNKETKSMSWWESTVRWLKFWLRKFSELALAIFDSMHSPEIVMRCVFIFDDYCQLFIDQTPIFCGSKLYSLLPKATQFRVWARSSPPGYASSDDPETFAHNHHNNNVTDMKIHLKVKLSLVNDYEMSTEILFERIFEKQIEKKWNHGKDW